MFLRFQKNIPENFFGFLPFQLHARREMGLAGCCCQRTDTEVSPKKKSIASNLLNCSTEYIFPDLFPVYDTTPLPNAQVIRSSVIENQSIYTEWNSTSNYLNPLLEHQIYRSQNGDSLEYIVCVDSSVRSYIDQNVDILNNQYDYIIINKNICETSSGNSNKGNSLLLNFDRLDNFRTKLNWNLYNGWANGTSRYELQKLNSDGIWETFINSDSTTNQIIINE